MPPRVSYFYDTEVGSFFYGQEHPMKPFRIKMAHQLIVNYGLYRKMSVYVSQEYLAYSLISTCYLVTPQSNRRGDERLPLSWLHSTSQKCCSKATLRRGSKQRTSTNVFSYLSGYCKRRFQSRRKRLPLLLWHVRVFIHFSRSQYRCCYQTESQVNWHCH